MPKSFFRKLLFLWIVLFYIGNTAAQQKYSYSSLKHISKEKKRLKVRPDNQTKVFIFYAPECPICKALVVYLNELNQKFQGHPIAFHLIIPQSLHYSPKDILDNEVIDSLKLPVFLDKKDRLTKQLGATVTPQVIVLQNTTLIYSGMINDLYVSLGVQKKSALQHFLIEALEAHLKAKQVLIKTTIPIGCYINSSRK